MNHKKRPGYQGCSYCKPHKAMGNSKQALKPKDRRDEVERKQIELERQQRFEESDRITGRADL